MRTLDLDESFIDPFLELAPFSARSEKTYDEGRTKVEHRQIIGNLPIPIDNLKAHLPFLAIHLQEALAESVSAGNPNQIDKSNQSIIDKSALHLSSLFPHRVFKNRERRPPKQN
ncbi:Dehydrogenase reductase SDR member 1 [Schistosoma haematobium]|uniref:Dehydrogenase reductase SDR member 1 n=1 Tax=Schistosoma haematobium TaxID=6185 RepID=A0A6A5DVL2_SCHHA|nr:Dehydrogenase reductase SDR member 1 [Schistosoma haematobium]KAH9590584.1 Dehydrogenase reductase SDR member 1 [Schistosoma haematobium]